MKTQNGNHIYNLEVIEVPAKGYSVSVDGVIENNEKMVNAYGGNIQTFEWLVNLYNHSENGTVPDPVIMSEKSRLETVLLLAVTRAQSLNQGGR